MKDLLEKGAVVQRDMETYAIAPHLTGGLITPKQLRDIADVAEKYNASAVKVTGAQRIAIVGLKEEDIDNAWADLGMKPGAAIGLCVRSVKICPGTTFCKRGLQDSVAIGSKLDGAFHGRNLPNKLKIGVSGCPNSCADSHTRDIGLIGGPKGWILYLGGRGGVIPRLGDRIAMNIPDERIFQIEDGQPWISAYEITCFGVNTSEDIGKGLSRESVGILNPELLYNINIASYGFYNKTGCSEIDYLIPYKVFYNKASNTITSYIDYTSFFRKNKRFYGIVLEDANARDLGFNYGLADTTQNIRFKKNVNLSNSITPTQGFYHKGYSCGVSSGCNNYSPYESRYHFYLTKLPASIHIKLWRDFPAKESQPEDINYEIIFN